MERRVSGKSGKREKRDGEKRRGYKEKKALWCGKMVKREDGEKRG